VRSAERSPATRAALSRRSASSSAISAGAGRSQSRRASDLGLIPRVEQRLVAGEHEPNAPGEAPPLGLDEMTDDFLGAPLTRRRMPREDVVRMGRELRANRRGRTLDQAGDLVRCEGPEWPRHRRVSSRAMTSR
jgi:hypothetical protein